MRSHLEEASLQGIHNQQLHLIEGHEWDHLGQGGDTHGGVGLRQLLQQPQDGHLLNGLHVLAKIRLLRNADTDKVQHMK